MIISASRRTDIPAFYSDWFMERIREGHFLRVNPFNRSQTKQISLAPDDVEAIVFWSKHPRPLLAHLRELDQRGHRYYFQVTLNPYDTAFEPNLPALAERIATMRSLAEQIGPERLVWRYDPVILSNVTPAAWHLEKAAELAQLLDGASGRLVFSFCDFYGKGPGRFRRALQGSGIAVEDITAPEQREALEMVAKGFKEIADRQRMAIFSCCEEVDLAGFGIEHGACIDARLIRTLFKRSGTAARDRNQRSVCGCAASADMGFYNSCPFRCAYCYANLGSVSAHCPLPPPLHQQDHHR